MFEVQNEFVLLRSEHVDVFHRWFRLNMFQQNQTNPQHQHDWSESVTHRKEIMCIKNQHSRDLEQWSQLMKTYRSHQNNIKVSDREPNCQPISQNSVGHYQRWTSAPSHQGLKSLIGILDEFCVLDYFIWFISAFDSCVVMTSHTQTNTQRLYLDSVSFINVARAHLTTIYCKRNHHKNTQYMSIHLIKDTDTWERLW